MVIIKRRRLFKKEEGKNNSKMLLAHEKNWSRKKDISGPTFFQWRKPENKLRRRGNFSRIIALTRVAFTAMSGEEKRWICTSLERQINPHWSTTLEHSGLFLEKREKWTELTRPPSVTTDRDHCRDPTDPAPLSSRRCKRRKGWGGLANDVTSRDRPGRGLEPGTCFPEHRLGGWLHGKICKFSISLRVSCTVAVASCVMSLSLITFGNIR